MLDEQRSLIRLVFADLKLDEGKLSCTYSKTFKILSEAVEATNGSNVDKFKDFGNGKFEPAKKSDVTRQKDTLLPSRPIWLPNPEIIRATVEKILKAFENVIQTELIKIRWQEICKFQSQPRLA